MFFFLSLYCSKAKLSHALSLMCTPRLSVLRHLLPKGRPFQKTEPVFIAPYLTFSLPDDARVAWLVPIRGHSALGTLYLGSFSWCFSYHPDSFLIHCRSSLSDSGLPAQVLEFPTSVTRSRQTWFSWNFLHLFTAISNITSYHWSGSSSYTSGPFISKCYLWYIIISTRNTVQFVDGGLHQGILWCILQTL